MISGKTWRVARTEYGHALRTKAFIVSIILMPLLMGGSVLVKELAEKQKDIDTRTVAVIDPSGEILPALQAATKIRNENAIWEDGPERLQTEPKWDFIVGQGTASKLSDQVRNEELFAYLRIPENAVFGGPGVRIAYHTNTPTYRDLPRWVEKVANQRIQQLRFAASDIDRKAVSALMAEVPVGRFGLIKTDADGNEQDAEAVNEIATFLVPLVTMMLLFAMVMMSGPTLMNSVLEEKMQRISEVLVSAVSPFELFLGKVLGAVMISWTLAALYIGGLFVLSRQLEFAELVRPEMIAWFLLFQLLALLIYGSIFSAIGAACSELKDAQAMMMPAMLLVMIPMFTWMPVVQSPSGGLSKALSIFPTSAPFIMLIRLSVPPGPSTAEIIAAVVSTVLFTLLCVWAASRIFRVGILSQGQAPNFRKMIGWIFSR